MGGACSMHGSYEKCVQNFIGKPEEKRPLGRTSHRWGIVLDWILRK